MGCTLKCMFGCLTVHATLRTTFWHIYHSTKYRTAVTESCSSATTGHFFRIGTGNGIVQHVVPNRQCSGIIPFPVLIQKEWRAVLMTSCMALHADTVRWNKFTKKYYEEARDSAKRYQVSCLHLPHRLGFRAFLSFHGISTENNLGM